jgi:hypothetical protein
MKTHLLYEYSLVKLLSAHLQMQPYAPLNAEVKVNIFLAKLQLFRSHRRMLFENKIRSLPQVIRPISTSVSPTATQPVSWGNLIVSIHAQR